MDPVWFGAIVASIAAVVVAWQSWETRRNANAALEAARAANEALDLARLEEGHTRTLIREAVKTRIDASTPVVHIHLKDPMWPPIERLPGNGPSVGEMPAGTRFTMPRDQNTAVLVRQPFVIANPNAASIELSAGETVYSSVDNRPWNELAGSPFIIPAGQEWAGYIVVQRSLGEWVGIFEMREKGEPGPEWSTTFSYVDQADASAMDTYEIRTGGVPIERVPQELGGWQIASLRSPGSPFAVVGAGLRPRLRRYWLSRIDEKPLD